MNITKEQVDKTTVKLNIELMHDEMKPYLAKATEAISKEVKIDGFRPGKAPYEKLAVKVGAMEIYQEASREAVNDILPKAVKREGVDFVGQPDVAIEKLAPDNDFVFTVTFALMPSVELKDYTKIAVKKDEVEIDKVKLEQTLNDLRQLHATAEEVDEPVKDGYQVVTDFLVKQDGVQIEGGQGNDVPVQVGAKQFIPGFEEELVGMKKGDKKEFKLTFPEDYGAKQLAGKECDFEVTVKTVNNMNLPELDDEFAKKINFESAAELREKVEENIKLEVSTEADRKYEIDVIDAAIEASEFDPIPDQMVVSEINQMVNELQQELVQQGANMKDYLEHIKKTEEELREGWNDQAMKRIKGALLLKAVTEAEDIKVEEAHIDGEVARYKEAYKDTPEHMARVEGFEFRAYVRSMLSNQMAVDKLKEYAEKNAK